jgi:hypothetical protein
MLPPHILGYYCAVTGLSMVAGWYVSFRNRPYLGALGGFFLALAASLMVYDYGSVVIGPPDAEKRVMASAAMKWVLRGTTLIAVAAFVAAVVMAVQESQQRLREVRAHYQAAAEALMAISQAKEEQLRREKLAAPPPKTEDRDEKKDV